MQSHGTESRTDTSRERIDRIDSACKIDFRKTNPSQIQGEKNSIGNLAAHEITSWQGVSSKKNDRCLSGDRNWTIVPDKQDNAGVISYPIIGNGEPSWKRVHAVSLGDQLQASLHIGSYEEKITGDSFSRDVLREFIGWGINHAWHLDRGLPRLVLGCGLWHGRHHLPCGNEQLPVCDFDWSEPGFDVGRGDCRVRPIPLELGELFLNILVFECQPMAGIHFIQGIANLCEIPVLDICRC